MEQASLNTEKIITKLMSDFKKILHERAIHEPLIIGIQKGGVWVAERLREQLGVKEPVGTLDISFYRDDFTQIGLHPEVKPSILPFDVDKRNIILIDDVIYTGRTIRAALNEIFDYGRPKRVLLGALIEREGRELPIQSDVVGKRVKISPDQNIKLLGPAPLKLVKMKRHVKSDAVRFSS